MEKAIEVAKYVLNICNEVKEPIDNVKLNYVLKSLDDCHITEKHGRRLFKEEFENWTIGAIVPDVFYEFAGFGNDPIYLPSSLRFNYAQRKLSENSKIFICEKLPDIIGTVIDERIGTSFIYKADVELRKIKSEIIKAFTEYLTEPPA